MAKRNPEVPEPVKSYTLAIPYKDYVKLHGIVQNDVKYRYVSEFFKDMMYKYLEENEGNE